ncbi:MAG: retroviral-like aspartic protease family protein [Proteobacteria bacterium]|nr:retroviral-like aspartic protease family protein [Pseudomonadota bacterium]
MRRYHRGPYIEGRPLIPRLNIDGYVSFLVDTGADTTVLMQTDGARLGLDYSRLKNETFAIGVGGEAKIYREPVNLVFSEAGTRIHLYVLDLHVLEPKSANKTMPSLLGRNILNRWRMSYNATNKRLFFEVLSADLTRAIPA